jgi:hypothetical protein
LFGIDARWVPAFLWMTMVDAFHLVRDSHHARWPIRNVTSWAP